MDTATEKKLADLCEDALSKMHAVNSATQELLKLMLENARNGKFEYTNEHVTVIDKIKHFGLAYDSASFVKEKVLNAPRSKVVDIELAGKDRSLENLTEWINEALSDNNFKDRGFVYVAWKARPESFYYIGRAGSNSRAQLAQHGKLLEALKDSTYLSFVFPGVSTEDNIANLEAALMHLVEFKTNDLPVHNKRKEKFRTDDYDCGRDLNAFSRLMAKIQSQLDAI